MCCRTLEYLRGKCIQAGFGSSGLWTNCSLRVWLYPVRCIVRKASSCALCSLNPPVPVLGPPSSSHLAGFHLPWSWQKDDDGNPKKFLCPWKCFAPDLKLFEKWLCKYAVSVFSFFQHFGLRTVRIPASFFYTCIPGFRIFFIWPRSPEF